MSSLVVMPGHLLVGEVMALCKFETVCRLEGNNDWVVCQLAFVMPG